MAVNGGLNNFNITNNITYKLFVFIVTFMVLSVLKYCSVSKTTMQKTLHFKCKCSFIEQAARENHCSVLADTARKQADYF